MGGSTTKLCSRRLLSVVNNGNYITATYVKPVPKITKPANFYIGGFVGMITNHGAEYGNFTEERNYFRVSIPPGSLPTEITKETADKVISEFSKGYCLKCGHVKLCDDVQFNIAKIVSKLNKD